MTLTTQPVTSSPSLPKPRLIPQSDDEVTYERLVELFSSDKLDTRFQTVLELIEVSGPKATSILIQCLSNASPQVRSCAIRVLGSMKDIKDEKATHSLIDCLSDENHIVRLNAAWALGNRKDIEAVDFLDECLEDSVEEVQESASNALANIGSEEAIDALISVLCSTELGTTRKFAAIALASTENLKAMSALVECLHKSDEELKRFATIALGNLEDEEKFNTPGWIKFLNMRQYGSTSYLSWIFGHMGVGNRRASDSWLQCLSSPYSEVRAYGAFALGLLNDPYAAESLVLKLNDEERAVKANAALSLGRLGDKRAIEPLIDLLCTEPQSENTENITCIAYALCCIESPETVISLIKYLVANVDNPLTLARIPVVLNSINNEVKTEGLVRCFKNDNLRTRYLSLTQLGIL